MSAQTARAAREATRQRAIGEALFRVEAACDRSVRLAADPIGTVRRYRAPLDLELAALVGSSVAFGNAKAFIAKLGDAFDRLGPDLTAIADDELEVFARLGSWRHRVYRGEDLARLLIGARRVQRGEGSLGARFADDLHEAGDLRGALARFVRAIRSAGGLDRAGGTGARHLLADPDKTSGCKRLLLFLRWMVRPDDGVDLGLWDQLPPSLLLVPIDVHLFKLSRNLGFTKRRTLGWRTTEEITKALRRFDPADPVRFDFSLCHLGMLQRCPSRRDSARCDGCGVKPVCRHWAK